MSPRRVIRTKMDIEEFVLAGCAASLDAYRPVSSMTPIAVLLVITLGLVAIGVLEAWTHRARLQRIPLRIHVNGTRGKSSVTRLIAAGLRAGGIRTCAKTTGTLPRMIFPDGREFPVFRASRANVIEQRRVVETAVGMKAQALVIECMALQPTLQWLSESKLIRATHGAITNARADHLEVMGPTEVDVAQALCGMTPRAGIMFTAETRHLDVIEAACRDRSTKLIRVTPEEVRGVAEAEMRGFPYIEHKENVALALRVCEALGVDRRRALEGMWRAQPDPGVMTEHFVDFFGRRIHFVNGFAANDPESTKRIWDLAISRHPHARHRIAIFNCRHDRPERSAQLAESCVRWQPADRYVLIGSGTYVFASRAMKEGLDPLKLVMAESRRVDDIFEMIIEMSNPSALVMGMGNIGGPGLELVRYFRNRDVLPASALTEAA